MPGPNDPMAIGDFSKPVVPKAPVAVATPASASPTEAHLRSAEARLDADAKKDEDALKPLQTYADRLAEAGISSEKAAKIVDDVLVRGFYSEEFPITKTVKMSLRTRSARDTKRIQDILEAARPSYDHHYHELLTRLLLAASLERFGADVLPHPPSKKASADEIEKLFQERITYVDNAMSDPALRIAFQKLYKFDRMVAIALEEGAIENF